MRIKYQSDYPQAKRMHSVALRAPLACPMTGDGDCARYALHDRYGRLRVTAREVLVEARYLDWQNQMNGGE